ncbi:hypothetical protein Tco_1177613, partial [Tanacetum coccineum]
EVRSKFGKSVEEVFVGGGEALGVDEDESNRVIPILKDKGGQFDASLDEINLGLSKEFVIKVLEGRDISGESLVVCLKWVYRKKSRGAAEDGRRVLCYVWRKKKTMEAAIQRRLWDPGIKSTFQDNTLRARWF